MQSTFTQSILPSFRIKMLGFALVFVSLASVSYSQELINEGFTTVIPSGWTTQNNSNPVAPVPWFQGATAAQGAFDANSGAATSYAAADFESVQDQGTISNWLITPAITMKDGDVFTFYTRALDGTFPDRLQVRLSTNGASTDVGTTETSVGDFSTLLLDINPTYTSTDYPEVWTKFTITISGLGTPTQGRLAFRYFVEDGGFFGTHSNYIGVDDAVYTTFAGACAGTPVPGNTLSSEASVCPADPFSLSLETPPAESGLTYQWQSGAASAGPFTDIPGATSSTLLNVSETVETYYRVNITCTASGNSAASTPVLVALNPPSACYCIPTATDCTFADAILNVTIGSLNNSSNTCNPSAYTNYLPADATTELYSGGTSPMSVTVDNGGADFVGVWIDYNHSGAFEPGEFTLLGFTTGGVVSGNIVVPASALGGPTRMRVRVAYGFILADGDECTNFGFGETEDYTVTIVPCVPGSITTQPDNASAACGGEASFTIGTAGSGVTYQWEERADPAGTWSIVSDGGIYSGTTTATLTLTGITDAINNHEFRAVIGGACTAPDFSTSASLTVTPLIASVSPANPTVCTGTVQSLSITNAASAPPSTTASFSSGALSLVIPDDDPAGASNVIAASGIPAGAVISAISVKCNVAHSYVGDLVMVLKAPNGSILNLDYYLTATGGPGPTSGFTNLVISSTGTTELSSGTDPWTGTFAPDAIVDGIPGLPTGPNGFLADVSSFDGLYSQGNGNWTLAVYDGFTGDEGTLTDWSIDITYTTPDFEKGVWSPIAGLFTDPAATVPYTGTPETTVYVKPTTDAVYSVVITTANCTSAPTEVPVTVSTPVTGLVDPVNHDACIDGSVSFSTEVSSTGPVTYRWQELTTDVGAVFTNISGATSATLTLDGLTFDQDGYQYRVIATAGTCGSDTSAAATLSIFDLPVVTIAAPSTQLTPGITSTVTATSTPAGATYNWTLNGSPIAATGAAIPVDIDGIGTYNVTVTDIHGCVNTSNDVVVNFAASDRLWIYPNPTSSLVQVRLYNSGTPTEKRTVTVFSSNGALVAQKEIVINGLSNPYQKVEFDLSKAGPGVYLVKVSNDYSKKIVTGFVIVAR